VLQPAACPSPPDRTDQRMTAASPTVFVVDDDPALRKSLHGMLSAAGLQTETCPSAREFLAAFDAQRPGCLVLDLVLRGGENGLELLENLHARPAHPPIIVLTAHGSVPTSVRALRGGAIDFIEKPMRPAALIARIREALDIDARERDARGQRHAVQERAHRLSTRERQIAALLMEGKRSKEIATTLGISSRTVEGYRARLRHKMQAESAPHLMTILLVNDVKLRT
jgi:two-component system, LuxR family, response regulator FixJ